MITPCRPIPPLRPYVRFYYQLRESLGARTLLQPVPARTSQGIEFMFATPLRVQRLATGMIGDPYPAALVGA